MRRVALAAAAVAAAGLGAVPPPATGATAEARSAATTSVGVAQREFRISLYRRVVRPGRVRFNVLNRGEDAHDLVIRGPGGFTARTRELRSRERTRLTVRLRRQGRYRLLCTVAGHDELGMRTTLVVRKARPSRRSRRGRR